MYSANYIFDHKVTKHNPNYVDGKCALCGEAFTSGRKFYYDHWIRVHKHKEIDKNEDGTPKEMYMCDICGAGPFYKRGTFYSHKSYLHGNHAVDMPCEHCQKIFKTVRSLKTHIRKYHKDAKKSVAFWDCLKCEKAFSCQPDLKEHVKTKHPDFFWTCPDCDVFKYTEANRNFHWSKCSKQDKSKWKEKVKDEPSIERILVPCEICNIEVRLSSLSRHYKDIHGIIDELFKCLKCPKTFKRREFWVAHLEMLHSLSIDDIKEEISKYNVSDRSKIQIRNVEGGHKGLPAHLWADGEWLKKRGTKSKRGERAMKRGRPTVARGGGRGGGGRGRGRGGKRGTRKNYSSDEAEEDEEEESEKEDEESWNENSDSDQDFVKETKTRKPTCKTRLRGRGNDRAANFYDRDIEVDKRLIISIKALTEQEICRYVGVVFKADSEKSRLDNKVNDDDVDSGPGSDEKKPEIGVRDDGATKVEVNEILAAASLDLQSVEAPIPNLVNFEC